MNNRIRYLIISIISIISWPTRRWLRWRLRRGVDSILVMRPDHLGDMLFASAALAQLRQGLPTQRIVLLVGTWNAELAARYAQNYDALLIIAFPGFTRQEKGGLLAPYRTLWQAARELRRWQRQHGRLDLALNLRFDFWWGGLLCLLAGIPLLGYDTPLVKLVASQTLPYVAGRHEVEQNLTLTQYVIQKWGKAKPGGPTPSRTDAIAQPEPYFPISAAEQAEADQWLRERGVGKLLIIHPGAGDPTKQWPNTRWATVAQMLLVDNNTRLLLTGNNAERPLCEEVANMQPLDYRSRIYNIAGETNLGRLAALLARADLVIGVDSGPLHLASTLQRPTLRLFGPSNAQIWGPWPPNTMRNVVIQAKNIDGISVVEVVAAAQVMLEN